MSKSRFAIVGRAALGIAALALILTGTALAQSEIAQITLPTPGTILTGASVTFTWTTGTNITQYYLYVGNAIGTNDIYGQSQATNTTATVPNLPTDGRTLYVRLWSLLSGVWHFNDYTYTAFGTGSGGSGGSGCSTPALATMSSPPPGTTLTGASQSFSWAAGCDITQYYLYVGSALGTNDIYGQSQATNTTATVPNLPTNGSTVYVRLWSFVSIGSSTLSVGWHFNDYTYTAFGSGSGGSGCSAPALATMSSPPPGTTLTGASQSFSWAAGCDITQYYLYVGSALGTNDIFGQNQGTNTTATVPNLPTNGSTVYVRLWSFVSIGSSTLSVGWHFNDYTYTAFGTGSGGSGGPTVVSYQVLWGAESFNVLVSARKRLPWAITGIRVVFSKPITAGGLNSLGGVVPTVFSGLGTNTLTWSINPIVLGNYATTLAGSGVNALLDAAGNPLGGGGGFSQNLKVLYGDFNDDGAVNSPDIVGINNATAQPYNSFADMNGDGTVSTADVLAARLRIGTSLP